MELYIYPQYVFMALCLVKHRDKLFNSELLQPKYFYIFPDIRQNYESSHNMYKTEWQIYTDTRTHTYTDAQQRRAIRKGFH